MKKKKLKKEIKELRKELTRVVNDTGDLFKHHRNMISNLGEKYTKLREELNDVKRNRNTDLGLIKDACSKADRSQFQINDIYEKLKILKLRTESEPPTCATCKYNELPSDVGPCMGCTKTDRKMYAPKEEPNER